MADENTDPQALSHLRVIELGDIPASYATRWYADLGADVIKVEAGPYEINPTDGKIASGA